MATPKKVHDIHEGSYLSDCSSAISLKSSPFLHEAADRPFAVPWYDPEGSTITSDDHLPPPYGMKALPALPPRAASRASVQQKQWYPIHNYSWDDGKLKQLEHAFHLETYRPGDRRSRLSITPSAFHIGAGSQPLSVAQTTELTRLTRHQRNACNIPDAKPNDKALTEPPDGGIMAWLHVVAGHLVVFNAQ